jgi:hypothetical protein
MVEQIANTVNRGVTTMNAERRDRLPLLFRFRTSAPSAPAPFRYDEALSLNVTAQPGPAAVFVTSPGSTAYTKTQTEETGEE